ncbi:hypothetical protein C8J56DRAFT_950930 [Mycena floridula]|nr:hypothetical protein C8J56DRAFT_950930 [Mycena floridula]
MHLKANIFLLAVITAAMGLRTNVLATPPFPIDLAQRGAQDDIVGIVVGQDACTSWVHISNDLTDPCGQSFDINGETGFIIEGCGGTLQINQNGELFATCTAVSSPVECDGNLQPLYHCT